MRYNRIRTDEIPTTGTLESPHTIIREDVQYLGHLNPHHICFSNLLFFCVPVLVLRGRHIDSVGMFNVESQPREHIYGRGIPTTLRVPTTCGIASGWS